MTFEEATRQDAEQLNKGEIDFTEMMRRQYQRQKSFFMPRLLEQRRRGQWQEFIKTALAVYEVLPEAFAFYDEIPDALKYDFAISAYLNHGDQLPEVREAVKNARQYGRPVLPEEIAGQEVITIYRAGEEPIEEAAGRLSWTTDIDTAIFFFGTWAKRHAQYIYTGKIKTADIIAYTDDRNEREVIQYGSVYDIRVLDPAAL